MPINPILNGAQNIATGQVSIATSATLITGRRSTRRTIGIVNTGSATVYLGASNVATTTGHQLLPGGFVGIPTTADVWGIGTAASSVTFIEAYD